MKRIILVLSCLLLISGTAMAKQKFVAVVNSSSHDCKEVNYYLDHGGKIVSMETAGTGMQNAYCWVLIEVPDSVPEFVKR